MFAYVFPVWGTSFCLGLGGCFTLVAGFTRLGQFFRICPTVRHCRQVGGEPDHDSRTFWPSISMIEGRLWLRLVSGIALASISHLVVMSLDPFSVTGAISTGAQYSDMISLIVSVRNFLLLIGTLSSLIRARGGSFPLGGMMGILKCPTSRLPCAIKLSASCSSSKKIWMNFVSALNLVPTASSGRASKICLPSRSSGILCRSRKAEVGSVPGGILVDLGQVMVRLL